MFEVLKIPTTVSESREKKDNKQDAAVDYSGLACRSRTLRLTVTLQNLTSAPAATTIF
jgi:hypothetical protein